MKKLYKKIIICVGSLILLWLAIFITDSICAKNYKKPVFSVLTATTLNGERKYVGIFYKVAYFSESLSENDVNPEWIENGVIKEEYADKLEFKKATVALWGTDLEKIRKKQITKYKESIK